MRAACWILEEGKKKGVSVFGVGWGVRGARVFRNPYVVTCAPSVRACVRGSCADARRPKQRPSVAGSCIRGEQHVTRWLVLKGGGWDVFGGVGGAEGERTRNKV